MNLLTTENKVEVSYTDALRAIKNCSKHMRSKLRAQAFQAFINGVDDDFQGLRLLEADNITMCEAAALVRLGVPANELASYFVDKLLKSGELKASSLLDEGVSTRTRTLDNGATLIEPVLVAAAVGAGLRAHLSFSRAWYVNTETPISEPLRLEMPSWFACCWRNGLVHPDYIDSAILRVIKSTTSRIKAWKMEQDGAFLILEACATKDSDTHWVSYEGDRSLNVTALKRILELGFLRHSHHFRMPHLGDGAEDVHADRLTKIAGWISALKQEMIDVAIQMSDVERLQYMRQQHNGVKAKLPKLDRREINVELINNLRDFEPGDEVVKPLAMETLHELLAGTVRDVDRSIIGEIVESRLIDKEMTSSKGHFVTRYTDSVLISMSREEPGILIHTSGVDILDTLYHPEQTLEQEMMPGDLIETHYTVQIVESGNKDFRWMFKRAKHDLAIMNMYTSAALSRLANSGRTIRLSEVRQAAKTKRETSLREFAASLVSKGAKYKVETSHCWCEVQLEREGLGRRREVMNPATLIIDEVIYSDGIKVFGNEVRGEIYSYPYSKDSRNVVHLENAPISRMQGEDDTDEETCDYGFSKGGMAGKEPRSVSSDTDSLAATSELTSSTSSEEEESISMALLRSGRIS